MCPHSPLLQTNFNLHQEKQNAAKNSQQSVHLCPSRLGVTLTPSHLALQCSEGGLVVLYENLGDSAIRHSGPFCQLSVFLNYLCRLGNMFCWMCCSVCLPCNLQHFGAGSCHSNFIGVQRFDFLYAIFAT